MLVDRPAGMSSDLTPVRKISILGKQRCNRMRIVFVEGTHILVDDGLHPRGVAVRRLRLLQPGRAHCSETSKRDEGCHHISQTRQHNRKLLTFGMGYPTTTNPVPAGTLFPRTAEKSAEAAG